MNALTRNISLPIALMTVYKSVGKLAIRLEGICLLGRLAGMHLHLFQFLRGGFGCHAMVVSIQFMFGGVGADTHMRVVRVEQRVFFAAIGR